MVQAVVTHKHACMHACAPAYTHTHTHTYTHTYTHTHTHTQRHTETHTDTTNIVESNMFFSLIQRDGGQDGGETASNATVNTHYIHSIIQHILTFPLPLVFVRTLLKVITT